MTFLLPVDFFKNYYFLKLLSEIPLGHPTAWIQIRPDDFPGLIWVQTVCEGYQKTTNVAASKEDYL